MNWSLLAMACLAAWAIAFVAIDVLNAVYGDYGMTLRMALSIVGRMFLAALASAIIGFIFAVFGIAIFMPNLNLTIDQLQELTCLIVAFFVLAATFYRGLKAAVMYEPKDEHS